MHYAQEIILHIGLARTGSTAIQNALLANKTQLLADGVLFPGAEVNHWHLQSLFATSPRELIQIGRLRLSSDDEIKSFIDLWRSELEREIQDTKPSRIIFSSEYIWSMKPKALGELAAYLRSLGRRVRVFAYLRDPWGEAVSVFLQELVAGRWAGPLKLGYRGDLFPLLQTFEEGFGAEIEARIYADDAVGDFAEWADIKLPASDERPNAKIGIQAACLFTMLNHYFPQFEDGEYKFSAARDWMVEAISGAFPSDTPVRLSKLRARRIRENSLEDCRRIEEKYFGGRSVFEKFYDENEFAEEYDAIDLSRLSPAIVSKGLLTAMHTLAERALYFHDNALRAEAARDPISDEPASETPRSLRAVGD